MMGFKTLECVFSRTDRFQGVSRGQRFWEGLNGLQTSVEIKRSLLFLRSFEAFQWILGDSGVSGASIEINGNLW